MRSGTGSGLVDYVAGLWTGRGREPVQPASLPVSLFDALAALENGIHNPAGSSRLTAAKAQLFTCLRNHLDVTESKALTTKLLNLSLARQHFRAKDALVRSRPLSVVLDPSNSCNLACPGCVHSAHAKESHWFDWKPGLLSATRFGTLLDRYGPAALYLTLFNYGEPTVNPETPQFIRYAKGHLLRTILSTNLSLPRFDAQAYVDSGLDYMVLSIDGATQPVYERFRKKGNLELVFQNIRKLVEAKRQSGKSTPIITWRFLMFEHNIHEVSAARDTARELGVDEFKAEPAWDVSWDDPDIHAVQADPVNVEFGLDVYTAMARNWNPFPQSLNVAAIDQEFDVEIKLGDEPGGPQAGWTCEWLYKNITMDAGGRIFPCCSSPRKDVDLMFAEFHAGSSNAAGNGAHTDTNNDVFNSAMHQQARRFFADPQAYRLRQSAGDGGNGQADRHPFCVKCEFDQTAFPDATQVRNYFAMAAAGAIDEPSLNLLSTW
jgi:MoaA/NifB/PqqE/SkfB family radical SAM enzyme